MKKDQHYFKTLYGFGKHDYTNDLFIDNGADTVRFYRKDTLQLHRWDGPAVLYKNLHFWFFNGVQVATFSVDNNGFHGRFGSLTDWALTNRIDLDNLTDEDISYIKLTWS